MLPMTYENQQMQEQPRTGQQIPGADKKVLAGILGILFGGFGVHKFVLGYNNEGIIMIAIQIVGWFLCGIPSLVISIIGIVEGIIYLTKSDEEFVQTYVIGRKPWF
jgi:TM2 domain-containing membrane protein YozV